VTSLPTLIVVSGPPGSGKTTLAHKIAAGVGCPAICRDEIKEGKARVSAEFAPGPGDELTMRTLPVFFGVLELLLRAGATTVAEAAFQDRVWHPRLAALSGVAQLRVVHCTVDADLAFRRTLRRRQGSPPRSAHVDPELQDAGQWISSHRAFDRVSVDAPWIEVDTADGYRPDLGQIVAFAGSTT
jgi:predicted kinase